MRSLHFTVGNILLLYCLNCNQDYNNNLPIVPSDNSTKGTAQSEQFDNKLSKVGRHKRNIPQNVIRSHSEPFCK